MKSWDALPARKKRNRQTTQVEDSATAQEEIVVRVLEERSHVVRAKATLEGQDGCAGEFYEYLDHTADVQFHVWGVTLKEAFANIAPCMFNFITDLSTVTEDEALAVTFTVTGHDLQSLLFAYMDEMLFRFCTDGFCFKRVEIIDFNLTSFSITLIGHGEMYSQSKHPQGTEIKAITYSNMQIHSGDTRSEIYVIVDI